MKTSASDSDLIKRAESFHYGFFVRDVHQPKAKFGTMDELCTCGATFHDHYNSKCPGEVK